MAIHATYSQLHVLLNFIADMYLCKNILFNNFST